MVNNHGGWHEIDIGYDIEVAFELRDDGNYWAVFSGHENFQDAQCSATLLQRESGIPAPSHGCKMVEGGFLIWSADHGRFTLTLNWPWLLDDTTKHVVTIYGLCATLPE